MRLLRQCAGAAVLAVLAMVSARADDVGQIKISTGTVNIERAGQRIPGKVGAGLQASDTLVTGADGSAGVTFIDNSRMSVGPGTALAINRFSFDQTTHEGGFDSSLKRGTLSVVSGKLAKHSPEAMTVRTPSTILGVRGTEFVVKVEE